jgi:hypothetical protein
MRQAPRNFTLTPKMVGKNPPLPRTYPAFRFVTTLASVLLFFTLGLNYLVPQMASQPPLFGMGGGGAPEILPEQSAAATEAPAAEAPAEEPSILMAPMPTTTASAAESAREAENPSDKEGVTGDSSAQDELQVPGQPPAAREVAPPIPPAWVLVFAGVAVLGALIMLLMRRLAAERWRQK